jgi:hypothetical protein
VYTCAVGAWLYRVATPVHFAPFAVIVSELRLPVCVGAEIYVRGDCFNLNCWFGIAADPLPSNSVTGDPAVAAATFAFTVVAVRSYTF